MEQPHRDSDIIKRDTPHFNREHLRVRHRSRILIKYPLTPAPTPTPTAVPFPMRTAVGGPKVGGVHLLEIILCGRGEFCGLDLGQGGFFCFALFSGLSDVVRERKERRTYLFFVHSPSEPGASTGSTTVPASHCPQSTLKKDSLIPSGTNKQT